MIGGMQISSFGMKGLQVNRINIIAAGEEEVIILQFLYTSIYARQERDTIQAEGVVVVVLTLMFRLLIVTISAFIGN
jgi:hypothetical protein